MDDRKLEVLRAIVTDYVATQEPVGSKALVERHKLNVSSATIRNDMAVLEEEGYLTQPHTSAGRIPTDKGYRLFVDRLTKLKPLSSAERHAIESFLSGAVDLDDVVHRTVRLLARATRQVAMVQYPVSHQATVKHVELVLLNPLRVMAILIDSAGLVEQRIVAVDFITETELADWRLKLNVMLDGADMASASQLLNALDEQSPSGLKTIANALSQVLAEEQSSEVVVAGFPNLGIYGSDFESRVQPVLEALEEQVVLLRLLGEAATHPGEIAVQIGQENPFTTLKSTSVVSSSYGNPRDAFATLGVLGPTHMDYPSTMAAVFAVANYVGRFLAEG